MDGIFLSPVNHLLAKKLVKMAVMRVKQALVLHMDRVLKFVGGQQYSWNLCGVECVELQIFSHLPAEKFWET